MTQDKKGNEVARIRWYGGIMMAVGFLSGALISTGIPTKNSVLVKSSSATLVSTLSDHVKEPTNVAFAFYAMGDTPYGYRDEMELERQIRAMYEEQHAKAVFLVHLGDLQKWERTGCSEAAFERTRNHMVHFPLTTLVIPGDNDYHECPHPRAAWSHFSKHFLYTESKWANARPLPFTISRWTKNPEMFVFMHEGILFLSVNLMDQAPQRQDLRLEWERRNHDNLKWIETNVQQVLSQNQYVLRGVFIFGHSIRSESTMPFFEGLHAIFKTAPTIPVVYLHGDGHAWCIDKHFARMRKWEAFRQVQVDRGGFADPLLIEIAAISETGETIPLKAEKELHYVLGDGLVRIDRRTAYYPERNFTGPH